MEKIKVDPESVVNLGFRSEDFLVSPAMMSAPLGGFNEYSMDCTEVLNLPPCPCPECGGRNRMVAYWSYPHRLHLLQAQGIHPIPAMCFDNQYNGGRPIKPVSTDCVLREGRMIREPGACEVILCWTTCMNARRLEQNESREAQARMLGNSVRGQGVMDGETEGADMLWKKNGVSTFVENEVFTESRTSGGGTVRRPIQVALPGKPFDISGANAS